MLDNIKDTLLHISNTQEIRSRFLDSHAINQISTNVIENQHLFEFELIPANFEQIIYIFKNLVALDENFYNNKIK